MKKKLLLLVTVGLTSCPSGFSATPKTDRFGQPVDVEFVGKVRDEAELRADAAAEARTFTAPRRDPRLDAHGGIVSPELGLRATGFFRVEKIRGRWWFVTPEGNPFFLVGCDAINFGEGGYTTPITGKDGQRRPELTDLPDRNAFPEAYPFDDRVSFLVANLKRKYGADFETTYPDVIRRRLADWGFNSTAKWGWGRKLEGVPYFEDVYLTFCKFGGNFVDMYHPDFERKIDAVALARAAKLRDDPDLIAWAVDNENGWWSEADGPWSNRVFKAICGAKDGQPGSYAHHAFLESVAVTRGVAPASLAGLDESAFSREEKQAFIAASSARYHRLVAGAFRKHDPNHLFMGASVCQDGQHVWLEAALPHLDFVGLHRYDANPFGEYHRTRLLPLLDRSNKPFAMLEFGFVCEGGGFKRFFAPSAICRDHRSRGQAYRKFAEHLAGERLCLGFAYFLYHDQAINGRGLDGEAYNLGLVSQQDRPYADMIAGVRAANRRVAEIHAGRLVNDRGWRVAEWKGAPALFHDGKPVPPILFWQWEMQQEDVLALSQAGVRQFGMFGSFGHYANPYFTEKGFPGLAYQERNLDALLRWNPEAAFLPRLFYAAPEWWIAAHPEECVRYLNPNVVEPVPEWKSGSIPRESLASVRYRREFDPVYRAAVRRLWGKYGDSLLGLHVCGGPCGEHHSWDVLTQVCHHPTAPVSRFGFGDGSKPMTDRFRRFLREKYGRDFPEAEVPSMDERLRLDVDGVWRDPVRSRRTIDYFECLNRVIVENLGHYTDVVKQETNGGLPTLAFYGYISDWDWTVECDHRAVADALTLRSLDMLSAPHTYRRRALGEDGQMRTFAASVALHGKFFLSEGDDRTHLEALKAKPDGFGCAKTPEDSLALLYREFGMAVTHGAGLWYMDIGRENFRDAEILKAVARVRRASEESLRHDRSHVSEVAVVSNPKSEFYLGYRRTEANNVSYASYVDQMAAFYRAGAPFDWYVAEDLSAVVDRRYKVVVFLDCQYMTDEQTAHVERLKADGRTLVFMHATGYVSDAGLSRARMERVCGVRMQPETVRGLVATNGVCAGLYQKGLFLPAEGEVLACGFGEFAATPVVTKRRLDSCISVFASIPCLGPALLRSLYREANVHVYTDQDVVLSANRSWLMLHTNHADRYRIRLNCTAARVTDVTCGKVVAEGAAEFAYPMRKHATAVFLVE